VGELVPPGDPVALAKAIGAVTADAARHAACARRARLVAAEYDWEKCADRLLELYREGRGSAGGPPANSA
jgi:glycosyltransferase involved in cell wall biosynthesis